jgi:hypothetical protein
MEGLVGLGLVGLLLAREHEHEGFTQRLGVFRVERPC